MSTRPFEGRSVLVTGGSKGIGRDIALAFAQQGANVAVASRTLADLEPVAAEIRSHGVEGVAVTCDVTATEQVAAMAATLKDAFGTVDVLVNNAGMAGSHKFRDHPDELWHRIIDVNVNSVYYVSQAIVPGMMERGWGRVINMASIASKAAPRYMMAYVTSKHAVLGLTRAMATELVPHGVTVNAICPGYVETPMTKATIANIVQLTGRTEEQARASIEQQSPQNRLIQVDEVTTVALMLASEGARGITGQAINVDGGAVMF